MSIFHFTLQRYDFFLICANLFAKMMDLTAIDTQKNTTNPLGRVVF